MNLTTQDYVDILQLPGRYGDAIDDRNWEALDAVFCRDATFEVIGLVTMAGLPEIKRYMDQEGRHPLAHLMTNIHVACDGDTVRLFSRGLAPVRGKGGDEGGYLVRFGSYYDVLGKQDGRWLIRHRRFSAARLDKRVAKVDLEPDGA